MATKDAKQIAGELRESAERMLRAADILDPPKLRPGTNRRRGRPPTVAKRRAPAAT